MNVLAWKEVACSKVRLDDAPRVPEVSNRSRILKGPRCLDMDLFLKQIGNLFVGMSFFFFITMYSRSPDARSQDYEMDFLNTRVSRTQRIQGKRRWG